MTTAMTSLPPLLNIGIPAGTRLLAIQYDGEDWHLWTAIKNRVETPRLWEGTRIVITSIGSVIRVTDNEDGSEERFIIKG